MPSSFEAMPGTEVGRYGADDRVAVSFFQAVTLNLADL
jgi:hypothetical protein